MGSIWLTGSNGKYPSLDAVVRGAGLSLRTWDGWTTRSRSSGGFNSLLGIVVHHTASPSTQSFDNDWRYCAVGHPDSPVANMLLGRDGLVGIHAGGASNHAGKGGPWGASKGTVPLDSANSYCIGIEAQNNGVGENWSPQMVDAYERLCRALCDAYKLNPLQDIMAHFEWAPSRKIDPWGGNQATQGHPYTGPREWIMRGGSGFCDYVAIKSTEPPEDDDMAGYLYKDKRWQNVWLCGQGPATSVTTKVEQKVAASVGPRIEDQHDQTLACMCWEAWGMTVAEAQAARMLV